jgi:ATP-dependent RNA helicase DeaD
MNQQAPLPTGTADRPQEYVSEISFDDLNLSPELRKAIAERGYVHPTPVQARAFVPARAGKDVIVRSKTGTGKTAAFGLPLIEQIPVSTRETRALIMCPTRELAMQVAQELESLAKYRDIAVTAIYGGGSMKQQEDALKKGSAILVGTPGRVYDHIRRGNMKLETARHVVLDEADEMLNQGFYEEVTRILDCCPKNRQVMLFSATVPEDIQRLIAKYTTDPETLLLSGDVFTVDHIRHIRYEVSDAYPKPRNLLYVLEMEAPDNAIIFCNTRDDTELVTAVLNRNGFDAELLNGDLAQKERERVMAKIKKGEVAFMVATDLAARGIDISDLGHVINYSLPEDAAVYLHRVGRTGRIGKKGTAINLTSGKELMTLATLEKKYNVNFEKKLMPTAEEASRMWTDRHVRDLKEASKGSIYEGFLSLAASLKNRPDADELIAFMLKSFFTHLRMDKAGGAPVESAPAPTKKLSSFEKSFDSDRPRAERPPRRGEKPERSSRGEDRAPRARREFGEESTGTSSSTAHTQRVSPTKRLSDREMFALMQSGQPIPAQAAPIETDEAHAPKAGEVTAVATEEKKRPARRERKPAAPEDLPAGQVKLWLNLGKADGIDEASVATHLETLGAPGGKIEKSSVRGTFSYLYVSEAAAGSFEALNGKQMDDKSIKIERAR